MFLKIMVTTTSHGRCNWSQRHGHGQCDHDLVKEDEISGKTNSIFAFNLVCF